MVIVLYNPISNSGNGYESSKKSVLNLSDDDIQFVDITAVGDIASYIESADPSAMIVLSGGDGTINRFVNSVDCDSLERDIYYFPAGSGNDFIRDIPEYSGEPILLNKYIKNLPTVKVNGKEHKFINGVGFGIDGYCCEEGDRQRDAGITKINYTAIAIKGLLLKFKPRNATVTVDGVTKEYKKVWIAPVMNGRFYGGGMNMAPSQDRLNEERCVTSVMWYGKGKLKTLLAFPSVFEGKHILHKDMIDMSVCHEATVRFDRPTPLQIDGETVSGVTEYTVVSGKPAEKAAEPEKATV